MTADRSPRSGIQIAAFADWPSLIFPGERSKDRIWSTIWHHMAPIHFVAEAAPLTV
jgi:hypothetical protein